MNKKKVFIVCGALLAIALIGGTIAFFNDQISFENKFKVADGKVEYSETFDSPDNWKSCDTTPKTFTITNKSTFPVKARVKLEEYWKLPNSTDASHTTELSLKRNGENVAIINFASNWSDKWEKQGDWYVYKDVLQNSGDSTTPLIESVTFNCNQNFAGSVEYSDDHKTGTTTASEYERAKYHLFLTGQTIQAEATSWDD